MIYIHYDNIEPSIKWSEAFYNILSKYDYVQKINIEHDLNLVIYRKKNNDYFFSRFNEISWPICKDNFYKIEKIFKNKIFPRLEDVQFYDNKLLQLEWLTYNQFKIPKTTYAFNQDDFNNFISKFELSFPLVRKEKKGSSSKNVSLIKNIDIKYPCIVQEYLINNFDWRVCVIGENIFGFKRLNRYNDFRASGSGNLIYEDIPTQCIEIAASISSRLNSSSMAFDFIKNKEGDYVVLEMSYTYNLEAANQCNYFYKLKNGNILKFNKTQTIQEMIVKEILQERTNHRAPNTLCIF